MWNGKRMNKRNETKKKQIISIFKEYCVDAKASTENDIFRSRWPYQSFCIIDYHGFVCFHFITTENGDGGNGEKNRIRTIKIIIIHVCII